MLPDDKSQVYYPGIVDQETLATCLETAEQIIRNNLPDRAEERIARFHLTKVKLIAQVKAHPLSFDKWNAASSLAVPAQQAACDCAAIQLAGQQYLDMTVLQIKAEGATDERARIRAAMEALPTRGIGIDRSSGLLRSRSATEFKADVLAAIDGEGEQPAEG